MAKNKGKTKIHWANGTQKVRVGILIPNKVGSCQKALNEPKKDTLQH